MKSKFALSIYCLLSIVLSSSAQTIRTEKIFAGYIFTQNGIDLRMSELADRVSDNMAANKLMRTAKRRKVIGTAIAGVGGTLTILTTSAALGNIYFPIGIPVTIGAIFTGIALPIFIGANRKAFQAVQVYNNSLENQTNRNFKPQFEFTALPNGIGFLVNF